MTEDLFETGDIIADYYRISRKEQNGSYSQIYQVYEKDKPKGRYFALKIIPYQNYKDDSDFHEQLQLERDIHREMSHDFIIPFHDSFYFQDHFCLLTPYIYSGDLLIQRPRKEQAIRRLFYQLVQAVSYLHSQGIIHRDLKPENILYDLTKSPAKIQLADFGSATNQCPNGDFIGTPVYFSPERLQRKDYDYSSDTWSLGIVLYEMLFGRFPWKVTYRESEEQLLKKIQRACPLTFPHQRSIQSKELINQLLEINPEDRILLEKILDHEWLKNLKKQS